MSARQERVGALGRGLAALIPQRDGEPGWVDIPIDRLKRNPYQPRQRMDDAALQQLAASITEHGVIQPVLVTETLDGYQLIAGERRVRAAQLAGLDHVPAIVRQLTGPAQLEVAIVENVQREDLDPIEEAHAYRQLIDEFNLSQEDVATKVGRARSTIANTLRLLELEPAVQEAIHAGAITEGHARALGGLPGPAQLQLVDAIVRRDLSVRQTEELARRLREGPAPRAARETAPLGAELERVEEDLRHALGTKVSLARSRRGGRIVIEYYSDEELSRLYERLIGGTA